MKLGSLSNKYWIGEFACIQELSKNHTFLEDGFEKPLKGVVNDVIKNLRFIKT